MAANDGDKTEKSEQQGISNDDIANAGWAASIFKPSVGIGAGAILSGRGDERGGKIIAVSIGVILAGIVVGLIMLAVVMDKQEDMSRGLGPSFLENPKGADCSFDSKPTKQQRQRCPAGFSVSGS